MILSAALGIATVAVAAPAYAEEKEEPRAAVKAEVGKHSVKFTIFSGTTGEALAGARVTLKGGETTAMTGDDGTATLNLPEGDVTVVVNAPGYKMTEVGVRSRREIGVTLNLNYDAALPIGQTVADQSVADLSGDLFAISRSGMPGAGYSVFVDGIHSINTSSQPLYVIDGQVWEPNENSFSIIPGYNPNPLALIDPTDIESVKVLRNGAAIYGSKGGNGVVYITTRRARNEATVIEAFANLGTRQKISSIPMMNASDYRLYATDVMKGMFTNSSMLDKFNFLNDDKNLSSYLGSHADTNWLDCLTRNALLMNYGINVRGGDDRALYAFSLGYTKNEAPVKETSFDRLNIRFNSDINLWKGFKLRFDVAFAQATTKMFGDGMDPVSSPYYLSLVKAPVFATNIFTASGQPTDKLSDVDELGIGNPLSILDLGKGESRNYRFNLIASPTYTIKNWTVGGTIGYIFDKDKENTFLPDYGVEDVPLINNTGETYATIKQAVKNLMNRRTTFSSDVFVTYTPFNDYNNYLTFTGGWRYQNDTWIMSYGQGYNSGSDYVKDLNATDSNLYASDGFGLEWRNVGWFLTGDYSWRNRYFLSASGVMESSSRFGKKAPGAAHFAGTSWGFFPSVEGAWVISNENFMANASKVNLLKLRLSYAIAGNDNLPVNAGSTYFVSTPFMNNVYGYTLANIGNDRLKWESTGTARLGIDAAFFNNRLNLSLEGFLSTTDNLLMLKQLQDVAGIESYWTNGGSLRNRGGSLAISGRVVETRDWHFDLGAQIGMYRNKVTKLNDGDFITDIAGGQVLTSVGNPVGLFYGYNSEGVFSTAAEAADANLKMVNSDGSMSLYEAGDIHFADRDGNGIINDKDRMVIGNPNPDFYGNINMSLNWKNFTLSTMFTYSVGNDVYNALRANLESGSDIYNQSTAMTNRWRANGQVTDMPRATYGDPMGNARFSNRWIEDGSYLRWKSLQLSYKLPLRSSFIQGLTFTFSVTNLVTWTKYLGPDPECYSGSSPLYMGIDSGLMPQSREFNFGIKINL